MNRLSVKPSSRKARPAQARRGARGGTLIGIFIGLIIGLGMAAGVAFWLMRNNPAFQAQNNVRESSKDATKATRADTSERPRFDFYKILPGTEEPKVQAERKAEVRPDRALVGEAKEKQAPKPADVAPPTVPPRPPEKVATAEPSKSPTAKSGDRFWLQAGSFAGESEAENLKARLALAGWEATVQQGMMPDKGVRYRVRLGPYDNADELNRIKTELGRRGFDAAVIKY
ncbi:MAG TPA: SPOR domain-containing protein [Casimicrobiaceae bacterium]|nr:SPOR domain-containing protein [Casimicrobiaceae bacterium]